MSEINDNIVKIINQDMETLSDIVVSRQYEMQPDIWERYGPKGRELSLRDSNYHFRYLTQALAEDDPTIFSNYVVWLKQLFEGLNFPPEALTKMLECTKEILREKLPPEMSLVTDKFIDTASTSTQRESEYISSFLTPGLPLHELAKKYLDALLAGKRHIASKLILEAVQNGTSIKDIYIYVFQQSQYEIGRLWYLNKVSVGQEHYCSAATQLIMSQLYPYIFSNEKNGLMFVAACVGGELHELGIRMVADLFEMDGWDTYYMGANTPTATVFDAVTSYKPDVLGISVSLPTHLGTLKNLISEIRNNDEIGKVKIIVGGYALRSSPDLWVKLGADGFALDAVKAVELANSLVANKADLVY